MEAVKMLQKSPKSKQVSAYAALPEDIYNPDWSKDPWGKAKA
jgi:hypothetical protein